MKSIRAGWTAVPLTMLCLLATNGCAKHSVATAPPAPPTVAPVLENQAGAVHLEMKALNDQRISSVAPIYPPQKRSQSVDVMMQVIIDGTGRVVSAEVATGVDKDFADAAITSVKQWRYKPYIVNGQTVPMQGPVEIHFRAH